MFERKVRTICPVCDAEIEGKFCEEGGRILLKKACPKDGEVTDLVSSDAELFKDKVTLFDHFRDYGCSVEKCREGIFKCAAHQNRKSPLAFIEITTRCNMRCPVCYADADASGKDVPYEELCRMLEVMARQDKDTHLILTGGEPTIHPDFFRILDKVNELGLMRRTFIATNCLSLAETDFCRKVFEAGVRKFYFAFDGTDPEACVKLRGSLRAYESVRKAIQNIRQLGKAWIILSFTASKELNLKNIPDALKFAMANQDVIKRLTITTECFTGRVSGADGPVNKRLTGDCVERCLRDALGVEAATFPLAAFYILLKPLKYAGLLDFERWAASNYSPMCGHMGLIFQEDGRTYSIIDRVLKDPRKGIYRCAKEIDALADRMRGASRLKAFLYYLPKYILILLKYVDKKFLLKGVFSSLKYGFNSKKVKRALLGDKRAEVYYLLGSDKYNFVWDRMPHCATHHYRIRPSTKEVIKVPGCLVFAFREKLQNY